MRFKRNFVTIAYSVVFILLMLLCGINVAALSYEYFSQDGMGIIFAILMVIGIILIFIGSFFLREKAVLRGIQKEKVGLIVVEGVVALVLIILGFCLINGIGVESSFWYLVYLAFSFGVCRMVGGRLCGIIGLVFNLALSYFAINTGWAVYDSSEIISVLCILVPFFVYLLLMKKIIPQFGKSNGVVIFALVVLCALFGAFICLNSLVIVLLIGCALSLVFANLRTVDTFVTKGPFMAGFLIVASAVFAVLMSFLLEKDLSSLIPAMEPNFDAAVGGGYVIGYFTDKIHNMLSTVIFHAFDYGIFSIILLIFAAMSGVYAIRRKLSAMGPMILTMICGLCGYVIFSLPESHGFYMTYLLGIFSAYGIFNMLLPEFLDKYDDEEEDTDDMFDTDTDTGEVPSIVNLEPDPEVKKEVAHENRNSSESESGPVAEAASAVDDSVVTDDMSSPSVNVKSSEFGGINSPDSNYQEWHVSNEFVRDEESRKERQAEREREIQVAKDQKEAKEAGKSEEEIQAIADISEEEKKQSAPGRVVFTGEDTNPSPETVSASIPPMSIRPADPHVAEARDMSQLENADVPYDEELHGAKRSESDTIVLSGYQNSGKYSAPVDILSAINETEIPQVEIPDVPQVEEAPSVEESTPAEIDVDVAEANEAAEKLSKAAATFGTEEADFDTGKLPVIPSADSDEQLDNLLERLDVSDSIKRMSETAREDMADVIEHADDKTEAELVLKNEDYKFGTDEGEYGEVPTISELEDRWRAEEQLKETPEENVPDVVSSEETAEFSAATEDEADIVSSPEDATPEDSVLEKPSEDGFEFDFSGSDESKGAATTPVSLTPPDNVDPTLDMLSFDSVANTAEERLDSKPVEPENEDVSLDFDSITDPEEMAADDIEFVEMSPDEYGSIEPEVSEAIPDESAAVEPNMEEILPEETVTEEMTEEEPESEFISLRDMATATIPEEILPEGVTPEAEAEEEEPEFTPIEPVGIEPEEIIPIETVVDTEAAEADTFEGVGTPDPEEIKQPTEEFVDLSADEIAEENVEDTSEVTSEEASESGPRITKFEPERIELPPDYTPKSEKKTPTGPMPVINHTEQSPVYSFTRPDITAPKEDVEQLVIPKPGMEGVQPEATAAESEEGFFVVGEDAPVQVETPVMTPVASRRPMAAMLDETLEHEEEKKSETVHTEEVVARTGGGTRSYHKIIIK